MSCKGVRDFLKDETGSVPNRYSGRYADGQKAYRTNVPRDPVTNNPSPVAPEPGAPVEGPHSRLNRDAVNPDRIYSAVEFDGNGNPVGRTDFAGRPGDTLPHYHPYDPKTGGFGKKIPCPTCK